MTNDTPHIRVVVDELSMRVLREAGFFSDREVMTASGPVRPRDVTESLLFSQWRFDEGEPDLTVMRVAVDGKADGKAVRHTVNLLDYYHPDTRTVNTLQPS